MPGLRRVDCSRPGLTRRRRGSGFEYRTPGGDRVEDPETLARIRELAIPPAWHDVWICPDPRGHLQAVGTDAAGRRQYLYHPKWRQRRDQEKFDRMIEFARALPGLRRACAVALESGDLDRERVLACAVRLLDRGFFRVGTEEYARQNETYGLATIRKQHVHLRGNRVTFDYPAKGGQRRIQSVIDPPLVGVVAALKRRRGGPADLLAYREGVRWVDVKSADINLFLKESIGDDFTAKDFRTWHGTLLASVAIAMLGRNATSMAARKRAISLAVQQVAHYLGNTPTVARSSYIDPRVFDRYLDGETIHRTLVALGGRQPFEDEATQTTIERAVLRLLTGEDRRPGARASPRGQPSERRAGYSHSMVPGGLEVTS